MDKKKVGGGSRSTQQKVKEADEAEKVFAEGFMAIPDSYMFDELKWRLVNLLVVMVKTQSNFQLSSHLDIHLDTLALQESHKTLTTRETKNPRKIFDIAEKLLLESLSPVQYAAVLSKILRQQLGTEQDETVEPLKVLRQFFNDFSKEQLAFKLAECITGILSLSTSYDLIQVLKSLKPHSNLLIEFEKCVPLEDLALQTDSPDLIKIGTLKVKELIELLPDDCVGKSVAIILSRKPGLEEHRKTIKKIIGLFAAIQVKGKPLGIESSGSESVNRSSQLDDCLVKPMSSFKVPRSLSELLSQQTSSQTSTSAKKPEQSLHSFGATISTPLVSAGKSESVSNTGSEETSSQLMEEPSTSITDKKRRLDN